MTDTPTRGQKKTYQCKNCRKPFEARVADRKRGWAKFCSKSCKASKQGWKRGNPKNYKDPNGLTWMEARMDSHCAQCSEPIMKRDRMAYVGESLCVECGEAFELMNPRQRAETKDEIEISRLAADAYESTCSFGDQ